MGSRPFRDVTYTNIRRNDANVFDSDVEANPAAFQNSNNTGKERRSKVGEHSRDHDVPMGDKKGNQQSTSINLAPNGNSKCGSKFCKSDKAKDEESVIHPDIKDIETLNKLMSNPEWNINDTDKTNKTQLHLNAEKGREAIVQELLLRGAKRSLKDKQGKIPLHYAVEGGHAKCVEALLKEYPTDDCDTFDTRTENTHTFHIDDVDSESNTALHYAVKGGYDEIVSLLLNNNANPVHQNDKGITPLHDAATLNTTTCLQLLLEKEKENVFQVDKRGRNIIHFAVKKNSTTCLRYLLQHELMKRKINAGEGNEGTPLLYAVKGKLEKCIDILLEAGALPFLSCNDKYPLHKAAKKSFYLGCEKLLNKDKSLIKLKNKNNQTALHMAARSKDIRVLDCICREMRSQNQSPSDTDSKGQTALHVAVEKADENSVKILLSAYIAVKKTDLNGYTALHIAAKLGKRECCKLLLDRSLEPLYQLDKNNNFPLDLACQNMDKSRATAIYLLRIPFTNTKNIKNFDDCVTHLKFRMRDYMNEAIKKNYRDVVEAMINSEWWSDALSTGKSLEPQNFKQLIDRYPELALKVLDMLYKRQHDGISGFTFLDNNYYLKDGSSPFDLKTGELKDDAQEHYPNIKEWMKNNLVYYMIEKTEVELFKHPLTQSWLHIKWNSYAKYIHWALVILQGIFLAALVCLMATSWNWTHINKAFNLTKEKFCETATQLYGQHAGKNNMTTMENNPIKAFNITVGSYTGIYWWVFITWALKFLLELFVIIRMSYYYWRLHNVPHIVIETGQHIATMALLFTPFAMCYTHRLGLLQENWAWQCGILAVLIAWLQLINSVNQLYTSTILPIAKDLLEILLKLAYFLIAFILVFAFIFYLLLAEQKSFSTFRQSIGSTLAWMMLDLSYKDIFVENPLPYPGLTNAIFFSFITSIGFLIANLITRERTKKAMGKELDTEYRRLVIYAQLIFKYDICFPFCRKKVFLKKYTSNCQNHMFLECCLGYLKNKDSFDVKPDQEVQEENRSQGSKSFFNVSHQVADLELRIEKVINERLKDIITSIKEVSEEIKSFRQHVEENCLTNIK